MSARFTENTQTKWELNINSRPPHTNCKTLEDVSRDDFAGRRRDPSGGNPSQGPIMPTLSLLPKGPQASLRLCCGNGATSLHSPGPMLGWTSLRGEAGDSLSETSSSSLTEDKTLVLAGGPARENPLRAFPNTRLLQGDTATPSGSGYTRAPARKREPQGSVQKTTGTHSTGSASEVTGQL